MCVRGGYRMISLIERESELRIFDGLLAECGRGPGRAVVIRSPFGIGKTALMAEAARRAVEAGARVVSAVASRAEQELPFGVIEQLLPGATETPAPSGTAGQVPTTALHQLS